MRWLGSRPRRPVASREQMRGALDRLVARAQEQPAYDRWALELRATGEVVGAIFLSPLPGDDAEIEIGWHLNPDHWGGRLCDGGGRT